MSTEDDKYERKTSDIDGQTVENTPVETITETVSLTSISSTTEPQQVQVDSPTDTGDGSSSSGMSNQPLPPPKFSEHPSELPPVPSNSTITDDVEHSPVTPTVDPQFMAMLQALSQTISNDAT